MLKNIVHFYDKIGPEAPEVGKWLILPWLLCSGFLFFEKFRREDSELFGETFGEIGR